MRVALAALALAGCGGWSDPKEGPTRLSDTGLYADLATRRLADGVVPYAPRYALWSDGAEKQRYYLLPRGEQIDQRDPEAWRFPIGTRVWKEFRLGGRLIETRALEKRQEPDDGGWFQMAYAWDETETDAVAVPLGVKDVRGTGYEIPAQRDCGACHYKGEKPVIGISQVQLGPTPAPGEARVSVALGYLHANCGHCHDERSAARDEVKVFMALRTTDARPEDTAAYRSLVGQPIHHFPDVGATALVAPGYPENSLVYYRMARRDAAQMPPLATQAVDPDGLQIVRDWIRGIPPAM